MTEKLLLVNSKKPPSKRKRKGAKPMARKSRKRRSAAQRAATRKLVAFNRSRKRGKSVSRRRRRRNPIYPTVKPRRKRAYRQAYNATAPKRRRRVSRVRRRNPIRRRTIRTTGILDKLIMPAVSAAAGAISLDILWAYLPLPANIKSGNMKYMAKAAGAIGMSLLAEMVVTKKTAEALGVGALTVVLHQIAKETLQRTMPQVKMDGLGCIGYYNPAMPAGTLGNDQMGYYAKPAPGIDPASATNFDSLYENEMGYYASS